MKVWLSILIGLSLTGCAQKCDVKKLSIKGIVTEKYRHWNHDIPVVKYIEGKEEKELFTDNWNLCGDYDLWNDAHVGDSIIKQPDSFNLKIKRGSIVIKEYYSDDN